MSIAVSARVDPSRRLMVVGLAMLAVLVGAAAGLVVMQTGELAPGWRWLIAAIMVGTALAIARSTFRRQKCWHIDISGHGQIRLSSYDGDPIPDANDAKSSETTTLWQLLPGSLLHPQLLLLSLASGGQKRHVMIWPDSVSADAFRRIALACRWIAARQA